MKQLLYTLPDGWNWISVKELSKNIQQGRDAKATTNGNYKFLRITDIQNGKINWDEVPTISLEAKDITNYTLNDNDLIFTRIGATIGKSALIKKVLEGTIFSSNLIRVTPKTDLVLPNYLAYFFLTPYYWEHIANNATGTAQQHISSAKLSKFTIPIAPLDEQKRIVRTLDQLLTKIDKTNQKQKETVQLTNSLFKNYLTSKLQKKASSVRTKLSEVCYIKSKHLIPKTDEYLKLPLIRRANIENISGRLINLDSTKKEEQLLTKKLPFDNEMILYSRIQPSLIKVARPDFSGLCSTDIYPISTKKEKISRDFLFYILLSESFTQYAVEGISRSGTPSINRNYLFNYQTYLPSLEEQRSICNELNELSARTNTYKENLQEKLVDLKKLKSSTLTSAFNGKL